MEIINITEIDGFEVGQAQDEIGGSGCSVIIAKDGAVASVDVRGGAPATRETDLLDPVNTVEKIHAVVLSGGSAFGLDAASGVMQYLEEHDIGFDMQVAKVPIVCGASLFDLSVGDSKCRPDKQMGYQACLAIGEEVKQGNYGAGTGASIGKIAGMDKAMKSGLGYYAVKIGDLQVEAIVAINACGDIIDKDNKQQIGGPLTSDLKLMSTYDLMLSSLALPKGNTTIGCILTNAILSKAQAKKIASITHNAYAQTIAPVHTTSDGDTIFVMGSGKVTANLDVIAAIATNVMQTAINSGFKHAQSAYGLKSWQEINKE
ncbi:MAG: P1 family peptidase [Erysipelotrichaceae bacterium]